MPEAVKLFKLEFNQHHSLLFDIYYVVDGLKLHLMQSGDCVIQFVCITYTLNEMTQNSRKSARNKENTMYMYVY